MGALGKSGAPPPAESGAETMRVSPPLTVGGLLVVVVAGLAVWRSPDPVDAALFPSHWSSAPLVALPWHQVAWRSFGAVAAEVPRSWEAGAGPQLRSVGVPRDPDLWLSTALAAECAAPVVLRWRDQWRGECRSSEGTRIRIALTRADGGWAGVAARYPDGRDARLAPPVARMLGSLREAE